MKKNILLLCLISLYSIRLLAQIDNSIKLANTIFQPGTKKAGLFYMDYPSDVKELQEKAIKNLNKLPNPNKNTLFTLKNGEPYIKYSEEFGLSNEEFKKLKDGFANGKQKMVITDTVELEISVKNGVINFKSKGKLSFLNLLSINTLKKTITYDCWYSTKEFERWNGVLYVPGFMGYEISFKKGNSPKKIKDNLIDVSIGKTIQNQMPVISFAFVPDSYQIGDKSTFKSVIIF